MKTKDILDWLDRTLRVADFDDVSNNGLQIDREGDGIRKVAFAVDASVRAVRAAAAAGADLLVVHHGISWGGGVRRISGGVGRVVREAMRANLAVYACHLPLDAHGRLGNNAGLARALGLRSVRPAFSWRGREIGFVGENARARDVVVGDVRFALPKGRIGVCSGGAGDFAAEARRLGCALYLTGEAKWGDVIEAENIGQPMVCAGHYATETFGVRAVSAALHKALGVPVADLTEELK